MAFETVTRALGKGSLFIRKNGDKILHYGGLVLIAGGALWAIDKAFSSELDNIKQMHNDSLEALRQESENGEIDKKKKNALMLNTAKSVVKLYSGPVIILVTGMTFDHVSYCMNQTAKKILATEAVTAVAALTKYRERVIADQGETKDREYFYGVKEEKTVETDEEGNVISEKTEKVFMNPPVYSGFTITVNSDDIVDMIGDDRYDCKLISDIEHCCNEHLSRWGYVFLNEALKCLSPDLRNRFGQRAGWVLKGPGEPTDAVIIEIVNIIKNKDGSCDYILHFNCKPSILDDVYIHDEYSDCEEHIREKIYN